MPENKKRSSGDRREVKLKVRVNLLDRSSETETKGATVYAFTRGGRVIASVALGSDGVAVLPVPIPDEATPVHVIAGPKSDDEDTGMSELLRRGAVR